MDLLTHAAAARVPGAFVRNRQIAALLVLGTFLPDLVSKSLYWVLRAPVEFVGPTHSPLGLVLLCYAASLFVEGRLRPRAFAAIFAGAIIHVGVDLLKNNLGMGACMLLYPFSPREYELGVLDSQDVVLFIPINVAVLALAWAVERRNRDVQQ